MYNNNKTISRRPYHICSLTKHLLGYSIYYSDLYFCVEKLSLPKGRQIAIHKNLQSSFVPKNTQLLWPLHTGPETSKWVNNSKTQKILILEKILWNKKCLSMQKLKVYYYVQLTYDPSFTWFGGFFADLFLIITVKLHRTVSTSKEQLYIFKF